MRLKQLAAAILACAAPGVAWASQDFTLVNRTGYPIQSIYVAEAGAAEEVDIGFDRNTQACRWNVLVKYRDDTRAVWSNLDLCSVTRFALFWNPRTLETVARAQ